MSNTNGSKWLTRERRLGIYLRDGLSCVYCGDSIDDGIVLTLDHFIPISRGGTHKSSNLITACVKCNCSRQDRYAREFIEQVAGYLNRNADDIHRHITKCRRRRVKIKQAKELIAKRGSWSEVMNGGIK